MLDALPETAADTCEREDNQAKIKVDTQEDRRYRQKVSSTVSLSQCMNHLWSLHS